MKDEIKKLFPIEFYIKKDEMYAEVSLENLNKIVDYITNLQQKIEQYENPDDMTLMFMWCDAKAKDKIKQLQEENEHLDKVNCHLRKKINNELGEYKHLCQSYYDKHEAYYKLKSRNEKAIEKIQYIIDYGFDYDGFNTVESLKGLIDMLVDYARQSKDILQGSDKDE